MRKTIGCCWPGGHPRRLIFAAVVMIAAAACQASAAEPAARPRPSLSGVWWADHDQRRLVEIDGKPIPFTAEGQRAYDATATGFTTGAVVDEASRLCVPEGLPRAMAASYPLQIAQTDKLIAVILESNRAYRLIAMNSPHKNPVFWDPSYMGESVGVWDGDTLVVDTTNFNTETFLDATGLPHSDQLHIVERIATVDAGRGLEVLVTITDPVMYRRPWMARLQYRARPDVILRTDWVCGAPHRDVSHPNIRNSGQ
jgi:hypothetical protein